MWSLEHGSKLELLIEFKAFRKCQKKFLRSIFGNDLSFKLEKMEK